MPTAARSATTAPRKAPRQRIPAKYVSHKPVLTKGSSSTVYMGLQLSLPAAHLQGAVNLPNTDAPYYLLVPGAHSVWLFYQMMTLHQHYPDADLDAFGIEGQKRVWIKCCDCGVFHETREFGSFTDIGRHLESVGHQRKVGHRNVELMEDNVEWGNGASRTWA